MLCSKTQKKTKKVPLLNRVFFLNSFSMENDKTVKAFRQRSEKTPKFPVFTLVSRNNKASESIHRNFENVTKCLIFCWKLDTQFVLCGVYLNFLYFAFDSLQI